MRIAAALALAALVCMPVSASAEKSTEPPLEEILARFFPGYVLVAVDDLDPAVGRLAEQDPVYADPDRSPSMIRADFDGNGVADYALLVREAAGNEPDEIFAVLMGQGRGQYSIAAQAFFGIMLDGVYLGYAPAGAVLLPAPGSTVARQPVELAHPAVKLIYLDSASNAFHWDAATSRLISMPTAN